MNRMTMDDIGKIIEYIIDKLIDVRHGHTNGSDIMKMTVGEIAGIVEKEKVKE